MIHQAKLGRVSDERCRIIAEALSESTYIESDFLPFEVETYKYARKTAMIRRRTLRLFFCGLMRAAGRREVVIMSQITRIVEARR